MLKPIEIPTSLRALHANWAALDNSARNFAYATVTVPTGTARAAYAEAKRNSGGIDIRTASAEQGKRYYEAFAFHKWLAHFVRTQVDYTDKGLMADLRDFYATQAAAGVRIAA